LITGWENFQDTAWLVPVRPTCPQYGQASPLGNVAATSVYIASLCPEHTAGSHIRGSLSVHATLWHVWPSSWNSITGNLAKHLHSVTWNLFKTLAEGGMDVGNLTKWSLLTLLCRNFLLNFSTPVFKMWIIQEPKKVSIMK